MYHIISEIENICLRFSSLIKVFKFVLPRLGLALSDAFLVVGFNVDLAMYAGSGVFAFCSTFASDIKHLYKKSKMYNFKQGDDTVSLSIVGYVGYMYVCTVIITVSIEVKEE
jgi:hypothetical protein